MMLCSPTEALDRIVGNLFIERVRRRFIQEFITAEDLAVVRHDGNLDERTPGIAIKPQYLIMRLADRTQRSDRRTVAEIGRGLEMISELDFKEICEFLGKQTVVAEETTVVMAQNVVEVEEMPPTTPRFSDDGLLSFRGTSVRFFSRLNVSAPSRILAAFESADWPNEIVFPLESARPEDMHEIRRRLQERVSEIGLVFSVDVPRKMISWRPKARISVDQMTSE